MNIKEAIEHCWDRKDYPEVFRDDAGLDISIPGFITRGSWIRNNSPRTVTLDVTTYRGVSWNAVHYYGNIIIDGVSFSPEDSPNTYTMCTETYEADEITLVLIDYQKLTTDAWFDYNVQKICSVAASMATLIFNRRFQEQIVELSYNGKLDDDELTSSYKRSLKTGAMFDARCFNIPKEEVTNCILWRQQDATRNSISSAGQAHFSHKQLEGLNSNQIQELLFQEKGINWNDYPTKFKRGSCCIKKYHQTMNQTLRSYWFIDNEIPIFKGEDREYIEKLIA